MHLQFTNLIFSCKKYVAKDIYQKVVIPCFLDGEFLLSNSFSVDSRELVKFFILSFSFFFLDNINVAFKTVSEHSST